ncbi:MAG: WG repeat-containing protein [Clostridia bacterium]|nr:WG repeat-containing protein [Clostridia bacterium]
MNKKVLICIISAILIVGIVLLIVNNVNKKKFEYTVEKLDEQNYFLFSENNKYGVINRSGNIVIDPVYDVVEIPNPKKDIFICKNNYNSTTKEYNVQVFNEKNEHILYQYYMLEGISLSNVDDNGYYEKSVLKYKNDGHYGLIDLQGKKITEAIYEFIEGFDYNEGLLLVKKDGKLGVININGAVIVKAKYDEIYCDMYYVDESEYKNSGYIVGTRTDDGMRYGYINKDRKMILKCEYNDLYRITDKHDDDIYIIAFKDGKAGVYMNNKVLINHEYENITYNSENDLFVVKKSSKYGVAKFDGTIIVPIEYDNVFFAGSYINAQKDEEFDIYDNSGKKEEKSDYINKQKPNDKYEILSTADNKYKIVNIANNNIIEDDYTYIQYISEKYFIAKKDKLFGVIDDSGNVVIDYKYTAIQPLPNYNIVELIDSQNNISIANMDASVIVEKGKYNLDLNKDYLKVYNDSTAVYIDSNGKIVEAKTIFKNNELFAFFENGKWGFKNKDGEIVVNAEYDYVTEFNEYGYAGIKSGDLWGSIDISGNVIKKPEYELGQEQSFIGEFYREDLGYGIPYYTR